MIRCPHCSYEMQVKGLRAGDFTPKCPSCGNPFRLHMGEGDAEPSVRAEVSLAMKATLAPAATEAGPDSRVTRPPDTRPGRTEAPREKPAPDDFAMREAPKVYQHSVGRMPQVAPRISPMLTGRLGGYELRRKLGQGGMGTVYLARQLSLDRDVAVKVLDQQLGRDAQFVSRFVREAYAAAQLVHHNVVQIHDIGEEDETHFYSMEYVKGQSLADLIRSEGAIAPDTAAGYILQAARGLKLAHDQGMIHRDIKPENLLLSRDGIVKVADLGLVKRRGETETAAASNTAIAPAATGTLAHSTMGTPAYIAPEQAEDAASVDARADIYSLGCSLFALLTGKPPFEGGSADEVLRKATAGEVPSPKRLNPGVPSDLARITHLMTARRRDDRYANIAMVIKDLEEYLGVEAAGSFSPRQQDVDELQGCTKLFNDSSMAALRRLMIRAFVVLGLLTAGLMFYWGHWYAGIGTSIVLVLTAAFYQVIQGLAGSSYLATRLRQMIFAARWRDWLRWTVTSALVLLAIVALDLLVPGMVALGVAVALAGGFHFTIDMLVEKQRHHSLAHSEDLFRGFRLKGLEEDDVRRFACEYAGKHWEEYFEAMFGYEAKVEARKRWGRSARGYNRPKYAAWRDPIIQWINHRQEEITLDRQRKHLLRVETKALQVQGIEEVAAARQAKRMAEMMMAQAQELKDRSARSRSEPAETIPPDKVTAVQKPREAFRFDAEAEKVSLKHSSYIVRRYGGPTEMIFGTRLRFALAVIVLLGFLAWRYENRDALIGEIKSMGGVRIDPVLQDPSKAIDTRKLADVAQSAREGAEPLRVVLVPDVLCDAVGSWNGGIAGLALLIGSMIRSVRVGPLLLVSAGILLFGHILPIMDKLPGEPRTLTLLIGGTLALATFAFLKREA